MSVGLAVGLQMIAIYVPMRPADGINNTVFNSMPMGGFEWLIVIGICVVAALIMELSKFLIGKYILKEWIGHDKETEPELEPAI